MDDIEQVIDQGGILLTDETLVVEEVEFTVSTPDPNGEDFDPLEPETPFDIDEYDYESDSGDELLDSELKLINAQLQWEESLEQIEKLFGWVILPLIGKVLGRRIAGVIWRKAWDYWG